jgi:hypothetical protein
LIAFVRTLKISRRLTYFELAVHFEWGVIAVKGCLERAGYRRYVARVKPPISEKNRLARIDWAEEHKIWTREQWVGILLTDETRVTGGRRRSWAPCQSHPAGIGKTRDWEEADLLASVLSRSQSY